MVKTEGWLAALQSAGAGVAQLGGHCAHEGKHCFVHKGAETWEAVNMKAERVSLGVTGRDHC